MKNSLSFTKALAVPPGWEFWILRGLFLSLLWGGGLFLWGSAAAYLTYQTVRAEQQMLQQQLAEIEPWLTTRLQPLQDLATDQRLLMGISLPGGLASAPVTRLLYEFSYSQRLPEVYIVDTASKTSNKTAGAGLLGTEVIARLTQFSSSQPSLLAVGIMRGNAYLVQPVPARLPQKVMLLVPINHENWSSAWPKPEELNTSELKVAEDQKAESQIGLVLPHTSGWAWWLSHTRSFQLLEGAPTNLTLNGTLTPSNQNNSLTLTPLKALGGAAIAKISRAEESSFWLDAFFTLIMLIGTVAIFWHPTRKVRHKIKQQANAYAAPALKVMAPLVLPLEAMFNKAKTVGKNVTQNITAAAAEPALINGPGAFAAADFQTGSSARGGNNKPKPRFIPKPAPSNVNTEAESDTPPKTKEELSAEEEKKNITQKVMQALDNNRISLLYQPIFRADDGKPIMHEIFARLIDTKNDLITPAEFLPVTQENALNPKLDALVFRKMLNHHFAPGVVPATPLALNIAATSLDGMSYLTELTRHGPAVLRHLAFEVRSQEIVRDANAVKLLKELQTNGGHLAVDYFGGGKTMLQASKALGFNYVRFDAMRYATASAQAELAELCKGAKEIGLPVILERIETPEMQAFARQAGVSYLQGYGLAKPTDKMTSESLNSK